MSIYSLSSTNRTVLLQEITSQVASKPKNLSIIQKTAYIAGSILAFQAAFCYILATLSNPPKPHNIYELIDAINCAIPLSFIIGCFSFGVNCILESEGKSKEMHHQMTQTPYFHNQITQTD